MIGGASPFAGRLRRLRERDLQLSRGDFAHRFGLCVGTIERLEHGRSKPSDAMRLAVAMIEMDANAVARAAWLADVDDDL